MMAGAFIIGFAVAYLIKFISAALNYFEHFSLAHTIALYKRANRVRKAREARIHLALSAFQSTINNDMLEHYYPSTPEPKKDQDEMLAYFYPDKEKTLKDMNTEEEKQVIFGYHGNR